MTLLPLALLAMLAGGTPALAAARPAIGIGEQKLGMFADPNWQRLGLRDVRYVAPWDALHDPRQRALLDAWIAAARGAGARVLLGFAHSLRSEALARRLPTPRRFEREFVRFRARYPDVRDWIVWNEANHPFSLTADRPRRAARYFDAVARNCARCRVVAADVLDVERDGGVGAQVPAPRGRAAAHLGAAQLRRRQPLRLRGHARPARRHAAGQGLVHRDRRPGAAARVRGNARDARVPLLAAARRARRRSTRSRSRA